MNKLSILLQESSVNPTTREWPYHSSTALSGRSSTVNYVSVSISSGTQKCRSYREHVATDI